MQNLINKLLESYPRLKFTAGKQFSWSPETQEIFYKSDAKGRKAAWSLLHETGHALLGHKTYGADYELLRLEMAAWQKARQLATSLKIKIDQDHIEDCLDTYRDWLHKRSLCPNCSTQCLQQKDYLHYRCYNCHTVWKVGNNRFTRSYRKTKKSAPESFLFK
jgi:hypothetical protein